MACNYIVSAQKPTVVTHAVVGNFRQIDVTELMVARINRLELLSATVRGLSALGEYPIYGRICHLSSFRKPGEDRDNLIVLTEKLDLAVLRFTDDGALTTRCHANVGDRIGRNSETGILVSVHPEKGTIAVRQNDGCLKIIQWCEDEKRARAKTVRIDDLHIVDFAFVMQPNKPESHLIAYIYEEEGRSHLKLVELMFEDAEINATKLWNIEHVDAEMVMPCPNPYGGFITIGQGMLTYHKDENTWIGCTNPVVQSPMDCFATIDPVNGRFLIGDRDGHIYMAVLTLNQKPDLRHQFVSNLQVEPLGDTTHPQCMCYIDNGVVFVGSRFGDSVLLRLNTKAEEGGNKYLTQIDSYPNLGPIQDISIMKSDAQTEVITCSGAYANGSLRIVRSGIGIDKLITIDIERVVGIFPLTLKGDSGFHTHLVLSHFTETRFLAIDGGDFEDVSSSMDVFVTDQRTMWIGKMPGGVVVQVTEHEIRSVENGQATSESFEKAISSVSVNEFSGQLIIAVGNSVHCYKFQAGASKKLFESRMEDEVASLDISSFDENVESTVFAVGFWKTKELRLYTVDAEPKEITRMELGPRDILRSILMVKMEGTPYVIASLADGSIHYFICDFDNSALIDPKKATLGTLPITLVKFRSKGHTTVFACGDRPTVLFSSNRKLVFSSVNMSFVETMCSFNTEEYPNTLIFVSYNDMTIGTVDDIKKLHIRRINVGESVRRLALQPETGTAGLLTFRLERRQADGTYLKTPSFSTSCSTVTNSAAASGSLDLLDPAPEFLTIHNVIFVETDQYEPIHVHELGPNEHALSIVSLRLGEEKRLFYVVGTSIANANESECTKGRVLVFECIPESQTGDGKKRISFITEKEVKGAVFSLVALSRHNKVVAAVNSTLRLFEFTPQGELRLECSYFSFINCLYLKAHGDFLLGGDMMRSVTLLIYRPVESALQELARDINASWLTACEIVDHNGFICAESNNNIFTVHRDTRAKSDEERRRLNITGQFYLGDMVNCFSLGELLNAPLDSSVSFSNTLLFGTVDGSLGVITQLQPNIFEYLHAIQTKLSKALPNCLRVSHEKYREFVNEKRRENAFGFVDGDMLEGILDMPKEAIAELVKGVLMTPTDSKTMKAELTVDELLKLVEDLSRIH
ncbi:hypothetical protein L596_024061 [Steinernema carpocapsae]|uniref:DNA damage-binding protein 1 n=1 Tax=Steinernema carpocapsae TaxID=34508 RepID=A0A4U5MFK9_STECR|nr:hypothetical protein L596_024061 [Steinernema carpocapsae]